MFEAEPSSPGPIKTVKFGVPFSLSPDLKPYKTYSDGVVALTPIDLNILEFGDGRVEFLRRPDFLERFDDCNLPAGGFPIKLITDENGEIQVDPQTHPMTIHLLLKKVPPADIHLFQAQMLIGKTVLDGDLDFDQRELDKYNSADLHLDSWDNVVRSYFPVSKRIFKGRNRLKLLINKTSAI